MFQVKQPCGCPKIYPLKDTLTEVDKNWHEFDFGNEDVTKWSETGAGENEIIKTPDYPLSDGCPRLVWHSKSITATAPDGGYNSGHIDIDPTKTYRRTVYIKKVKSIDGRTYFGLRGYDANSRSIGVLRNNSGVSNTNPYFWTGDLPETDKWFLLVGFIYPASDDNDATINGGIYEMGNATKVMDISQEYRWKPNGRKTAVRDYLYYTSEDGIEQYFFRPDLELVDGTEMPLNLLLGLPIA